MLDWQKHTKLRIFIRTICIVLIVTFFSYDLSWAGATEVLNPRNWLFAQKAQNSLSIEIPQELGLIKETFTSQYNPHKLVIHIQDAHANVEAQENEARIIKYLKEKYNIHLVSVEGGFGDFDASFFREFPKDKNVREKIARYFLSKDFISGTDYLLVTEDEPPVVYGAEDKGLYESHLNTFKNNQGFSDSFNKSLSILESVVQTLKNKYYSSDLREFDLHLNDFKQGKSSLEEYLSYLNIVALLHNFDLSQFPNLYLIISLKELENKISFEKAESERQALIDNLSKVLFKEGLEELVKKSIDFKANNLSAPEYYAYLEELTQTSGIATKQYPNLSSYIKYINLSAKLDNSKIFAEIDSFSQAVKERFTTGSAQKDIDSLTYIIGVLKGLANIDLSPKDYEYFKSNRSIFTSKNIALILRRYLGSDTLSSLPTDEDIASLEKFYSIAHDRDSAIVRNSLARLDKDYSSNSVILIAGGFHTQGITSALKEKNISYIVIAPNIKASQEKESTYFSLLKDKKLPIEDILHDPDALQIINSITDPQARELLINYWVARASRYYSSDELQAQLGNLTLSGEDRKAVETALNELSPQAQIAQKEETVKAEIIPAAREESKPIQLLPQGPNLFERFTLFISSLKPKPNETRLAKQKTLPASHEEVEGIAAGKQEQASSVPAPALNKQPKFDLSKAKASFDAAIKQAQEGLVRFGSQVLQSINSFISGVYAFVKSLRLPKHKESKPAAVKAAPEINARTPQTTTPKIKINFRPFLTGITTFVFALYFPATALGQDNSLHSKVFAVFGNFFSQPATVLLILGGIVGYSLYRFIKKSSSKEKLAIQNITPVAIEPVVTRSYERPQVLRHPRVISNTQSLQPSYNLPLSLRQELENRVQQLSGSIAQASKDALVRSFRPVGLGELPLPMPLSMLSQDTSDRDKVVHILENMQRMMDGTDEKVLRDFERAIDNARDKVTEQALEQFDSLSDEGLYHLLTDRYISELQREFQRIVEDQIQHMLRFHTPSAEEQALYVSDEINEKYSRLPRYLKWILTNNPQLENDPLVQQWLNTIQSRMSQIPAFPEMITGYSKTALNKSLYLNPEIARRVLLYLARNVSRDSNVTEGDVRREIQSELARNTSEDVIDVEVVPEEEAGISELPAIPQTKALPAPNLGEAENKRARLKALTDDYNRFLVKFREQEAVISKVETDLRELGEGLQEAKRQNDKVVIEALQPAVDGLTSKLGKVKEKLARLNQEKSKYEDQIKAIKRDLGQGVSLRGLVSVFLAVSTIFFSVFPSNISNAQVGISAHGQQSIQEPGAINNDLIQKLIAAMTIENYRNNKEAIDLAIKIITDSQINDPGIIDKLKWIAVSADLPGNVLYIDTTTNATLALLKSPEGQKALVEAIKDPDLMATSRFNLIFNTIKDNRNDSSVILDALKWFITDSHATEKGHYYSDVVNQATEALIYTQDKGQASLVSVFVPENYAKAHFTEVLNTISRLKVKNAGLSNKIYWLAVDAVLDNGYYVTAYARLSGQVLYQLEGNRALDRLKQALNSQDWRKRDGAAQAILGIAQAQNSKLTPEIISALNAVKALGSAHDDRMVSVNEARSILNQLTPVNYPFFTPERYRANPEQMISDAKAFAQNQNTGYFDQLTAAIVYTSPDGSFNQSIVKACVETLLNLGDKGRENLSRIFNSENYQRAPTNLKLAIDIIRAKNIADQTTINRLSYLALEPSYSSGTKYYPDLNKAAVQALLYTGSAGKEALQRLFIAEDFRSKEPQLSLIVDTVAEAKNYSLNDTLLYTLNFNNADGPVGPGLRISVINALSALDIQEALNYLPSCLSSNDEGVRKVAVKALINLHVQPSQIEPLLNSDNQITKECAKEVLKAVAPERLQELTQPAVVSVPQAAPSQVTQQPNVETNHQETPVNNPDQEVQPTQKFNYNSLKNWIYIISGLAATVVSFMIYFRIRRAVRDFSKYIAYKQALKSAAAKFTGNDAVRRKFLLDIDNLRGKLVKKGLPEASDLFKDILPELTKTCRSKEEFIYWLDELVGLNARVWQSGTSAVINNFNDLAGFRQAKEMALDKLCPSPREKEELATVIDSLRVKLEEKRPSCAGILKDLILEILKDIDSLSNTQNRKTDFIQWLTTCVNFDAQTWCGATTQVFSGYQELKGYVKQRRELSSRFATNPQEQERLNSAWDNLDKAADFKKPASIALLKDALAKVASLSSNQKEFVFWVGTLSELKTDVLEAFCRDIATISEYYRSKGKTRDFNHLPSILNQYYKAYHQTAFITNELLDILTDSTIEVDRRIEKAYQNITQQKIFKLGAPPNLVGLQDIVSFEQLLSNPEVGESGFAAMLNYHWQEETSSDDEYGGGSSSYDTPLQPILQIVPKMGRDGLYSYWESQLPGYYQQFLSEAKGLAPGFNRPGEKFRVTYNGSAISLTKEEDTQVMPIGDSVEALKQLIRYLRMEWPNLYDNFIDPKRELIKGRPLEEFVTSDTVLKISQQLLNKVQNWQFSEQQRAVFLVKIMEIFAFQETADIRINIATAEDNSSRLKAKAAYWERVSNLISRHNWLQEKSKYSKSAVKTIKEKTDLLNNKLVNVGEGVLQFYLSGHTMADFFRGSFSNECTRYGGVKFKESIGQVTDPAFFLFKVIEKGRWVGNIYSVAAKTDDGKFVLYLEWFKLAKDHPLVTNGLWSERRKQFMKDFFSSFKTYLASEGFDYLIVTTATSETQQSYPLYDLTQAQAKAEANNSDPTSTNLKKLTGTDHLREGSLPIEYLQNFGGEGNNLLHPVSGYKIVLDKSSPQVIQHKQEDLDYLEKLLGEMSSEETRLASLAKERREELNQVNRNGQEAANSGKNATAIAFKEASDRKIVEIQKIEYELSDLKTKIRERKDDFIHLESELGLGNSRSNALGRKLVAASSIILSLNLLFANRAQAQDFSSPDLLYNPFSPVLLLGGIAVFFGLLFYILYKFFPQKPYRGSYYEREYLPKPEVREPKLPDEPKSQLALVLDKVSPEVKGLVPGHIDIRIPFEVGISRAQGSKALDLLYSTLIKYNSVFDFFKDKGFYLNFKQRAKELGLSDDFDQPQGKDYFFTLPKSGQQVIGGNEDVQFKLKLSERNSDDILRGEASLDCTSINGSAYYNTIPQFIFDPGLFVFKVIQNNKWVGNVYTIVAEKEGSPVLIVDAVQLPVWGRSWPVSVKELSDKVLEKVVEYADAQGFTQVLMSSFVSNFNAIHDHFGQKYPLVAQEVKKTGGFEHLKALGLWDDYASRNEYLETFSPQWNYGLKRVNPNNPKQTLLLRNIWQRGMWKNVQMTLDIKKTASSPINPQSQIIEDEVAYILKMLVPDISNEEMQNIVSKVQTVSLANEISNSFKMESKFYLIFSGITTTLLAPILVAIGIIPFSAIPIVLFIGVGSVAMYTGELFTKSLLGYLLIKIKTLGIFEPDVNRIVIKTGQQQGMFLSALSHELMHSLIERGYFQDKDDFLPSAVGFLRALEMPMPDYLGISVERVLNISQELLARYDSMILPESILEDQLIKGEGKGEKYLYGFAIGGIAYKLALETNKKEDAWKFLRLVGGGKTIREAISIVRNTDNLNSKVYANTRKDQSSSVTQPVLEGNKKMNKVSSVFTFFINKLKKLLFVLLIFCTTACSSLNRTAFPVLAHPTARAVEITQQSTTTTTSPTSLDKGSYKYLDYLRQQRDSLKEQRKKVTLVYYANLNKLNTILGEKGAQRLMNHKIDPTLLNRINELRSQRNTLTRQIIDLSKEIKNWHPVTHIPSLTISAPSSEALTGIPLKTEEKVTSTDIPLTVKNSPANPSHQMQEVTQEIPTQQETLKNAQEEKQLSQADLENLQKQVEKLEHQLTSVENHLDRAEKLLNEVKESMQPNVPSQEQEKRRAEVESQRAQDNLQLEQKRTAMFEEISDLAKEKQVAQEDLNQLNAGKRTASQQLEQLKNQLPQAQTNIQNLQNEVNKLSYQKEQYEQDSAKLKSQKESLQKSVDKLNQEGTNLQQGLNDLRQQVSSAKKTLDEAKQKALPTQKNMWDVLPWLEKVGVVILILTGGIGSIVLCLILLKRLIKVKILLEKIDLLKKETAALQAKLGNMRIEEKNFIALKNEAQEEKRKAQEESARIAREQTQLDTERKRLQTQMQDLERQRQEIEQQKQGLSQIEKQKQQVLDEIQKLEAKRNTLRQDLEKVQNETQEAIRRIKEREEQVNARAQISQQTLTEEQKKLNAHLDTKRKEISAQAQALNEQILEARTKHEAEMKRLEQEGSQVRRQLMDLTTQRDKTRQELDNMNQTVTLLTQERDNLLNSLQSMDKAQKSLQVSIEELNREEAQLIKEEGTLKKAEEIKPEVDSLLTRARTISQEVDSLYLHNKSKAQSIDTFVGLVRQRSHSTEEDAIREQLKNILVGLGARVILECGSQCGDNNTPKNLVVEFPATGKFVREPGFIINAHMDTVMRSTPEEMDVSGQGFYHKQNGSFGADDKAGLAVQIEALRFLKNNYWDKGSEHRRITFIITAEEETPFRGAKHLAEAHPELFKNVLFSLTSDGPLEIPNFNPDTSFVVVVPDDLRKTEPYSSLIDTVAKVAQRKARKLEITQIGLGQGDFAQFPEEAKAQLHIRSPYEGNHSHEVVKIRNLIDHIDLWINLMLKYSCDITDTVPPTPSNITGLPKAMVFDLDKTLSRTLQRTPPEILEQVRGFLRSGIKIAIISAQSLEEIKTYFVDPLHDLLKESGDSEAILSNLYICPCEGSQLWQFYTQGQFKAVLLDDATYGMTPFDTDANKKNLLQAVKSAIREVINPKGDIPIMGPILIQTPSVTFIHNRIYSLALGIKEDVSLDKKKELIEIIKRRIPASWQIDILVSGGGTIHIVSKGVDKSTAVNMFRNYLPQDIQPQQILIVGDDFGHSGLDRKLIILGARVYSVGAKHNLPEGVIFYGEGGDHGWQRTLHLLINRIKHDFAGAAKGKGMLSPDKHMDINEIINSAQREQRGILIWGDASGWQVDHAKYAQDIAWSINSLKRYSSVKIPGLGRVDIPEILSESSIVLILPRANSPPGLLVNNENAYQIAHNGLSRNSIYIDEYIYSQLYTFEIAVLLAHEAILLGAKKLAAQRGMPWTEQLAKDVSNIAEEYEIQIVGRSSTGRGSNFDNRIEELLGFNNQAQQVPREYTHDEPVQLSEEPIIEPVTPPKPQVREEINSSRITPQPKMEERQRPASSRTVTLDFAETHNAALDSLRKLFSDSLSKDTSVGLPTTIGSFPPPMAEELRQSYYLHKVSRMPLDADFLAILTAFFARTFPNHANELILYLRDLSVYVIDNQESTFGATLSGNIFYVQRSCMEDLLNRPITVAQIYQGIKTKDREISIALFRIFIHEIGSAFFKLSHPGNQDLERLFLALLSKSTVTLSQTTETEVRTINNTVDLDSLARIDWANKRSKMGDGMQDKVRFDSNTASSFLKGVNARLINSLYSPNQTIRNNAAKALVRFKAIEALPYLELLAEKEPDNKVITDALSELETAWETTNSEKVTIKTADAFAKVLLTVDETGELALNENTIQAINTLYNAYNGLTLEVDIDTLIDTSTGVPKLKGLGFKEALASLYKAQQKKEIPTNLKIRLINIDSSLNRDKIIKVLGLSDDLLNSMVSIPNIPEDYLVKGLEPYLIQGSVRIIFEDNLKYWGKKVDVLVKRGKETETLSSIGLIVASLAKEPKFYDSLPKDIKEYIVAKTNGKGKVELDDEGKIKQLIFKPIEKTKVDTQYLDRLDKANKELDGMV